MSFSSVLCSVFSLSRVKHSLSNTSSTFLKIISINTSPTLMLKPQFSFPKFVPSVSKTIFHSVEILPISFLAMSSSWSGRALIVRIPLQVKSKINHSIPYVWAGHSKMEIFSGSGNNDTYGRRCVCVCMCVLSSLFFLVSVIVLLTHTYLLVSWNF